MSDLELREREADEMDGKSLEELVSADVLYDRELHRLDQIRKEEQIRAAVLFEANRKSDRLRAETVFPHELLGQRVKVWTSGKLAAEGKMLVITPVYLSIDTSEGVSPSGDSEGSGEVRRCSSGGCGLVYVTWAAGPVIVPLAQPPAVRAEE
jgi:hypothetical protein